MGKPISSDCQIEADLYKESVCFLCPQKNG